MKIYNDLLLKFEQANWAKNSEFALIDTILEQNPDIILLIESDVLGDSPNNGLGRGDTPSLEQIMRAAIFKELKNYTYRDLEYAQDDSRICEIFLKLDKGTPNSFQMYQKYISRISSDTLGKVLLKLNKTSIEEGLEDVKKVRQDSTVVETTIHYPTNNSLTWDCIKKSHDLLEKLSKELSEFSYINYLKSAKKTYFKNKCNKWKIQKREAKSFIW